MTPMGLCGRNKSSKNVKKTRGVLSWHPLVAAPNDTEGHGVWKSQKKSHFNIASEASYVYILSGQKFIKNAQKWSIWWVFGNLKRCDILRNFQTMCHTTWKFLEDHLTADIRWNILPSISNSRNGEGFNFLAEIPVVLCWNGLIIVSKCSAKGFLSTLSTDMKKIWDLAA